MLNLFFLSCFMNVGGFCHYPLSTIACGLVWVCPRRARWVDWRSVGFTVAGGLMVWLIGVYDKVGTSMFYLFFWVLLLGLV